MLRQAQHERKNDICCAVLDQKARCRIKRYRSRLGGQIFDIFDHRPSRPILHPLGLRAGRGNANLVDQFKRALSSAILNTVEGNGRTSIKERARFFDIAIASAAEAASAIEVMVAFGAIREGEATKMSENIRIGYAMLINLKRATAGR